MSSKERQHNKSKFPKLKLHKLDWLEWLSIAVCGWFLFYPHPYKVAFAITLSLPIIGLILNGLSRPSLASLVSISSRKNNGKFDIADFIEFPGLCILLRILTDFEFESFYSILKVGTVGFIFSLIILIATHKLIEKSDPNKIIIYLSVIGNIALYSYAATYGINCVFDNSEPQIFEAKIVDKSVSAGRRRTTYYLTVTPWGHHRDPERISVTTEQFNEAKIGQSVSMDYKKGLLNIPWYFLEVKPPLTSSDNKYNIQIKLFLTGNDSTGGTIEIMKNKIPYKIIESQGGRYDVELDLNEEYAIKCSKEGYISKTVYFDTRIPPGREKMNFADFWLSITLLNGIEENSTLDNFVGGVRYNSTIGDFRKVE